MKQSAREARYQREREAAGLTDDTAEQHQAQAGDTSPASVVIDPECAQCVDLAGDAPTVALPRAPKTKRKPAAKAKKAKR